MFCNIRKDMTTNKVFKNFLKFLSKRNPEMKFNDNIGNVIFQIINYQFWYFFKNNICKKIII